MVNEEEHHPTAHTAAASSMDVSDTKKIDNDSSSEEDGVKKHEFVHEKGVASKVITESGNMEWEGDHDEFPMRTYKITNQEGHAVFLLNPVVSFIGMAVLWGLSIWCMADPTNASAILIDGRYRLTKMFTWFYVGTNPAFMVSKTCCW